MDPSLLGTQFDNVKGCTSLALPIRVYVVVGFPVVMLMKK